MTEKQLHKKVINLFQHLEHRVAACHYEVRTDPNVYQMRPSNLSAFRLSPTLFARVETHTGSMSHILHIWVYRCYGWRICNISYESNESCLKCIRICSCTSFNWTRLVKYTLDGHTYMHKHLVLIQSTVPLFDSCYMEYVLHIHRCIIYDDTCYIHIEVSNIMLCMRTHSYMHTHIHTRIHTHTHTHTHAHIRTRAHTH